MVYSDNLEGWVGDGIGGGREDQERRDIYTHRTDSRVYSRQEHKLVEQLYSN